MVRETDEWTAVHPRQIRVVNCLRAIVESGPDAGLPQAIERGAALTVGTATGSDLVLKDPAVSRYHLELRHGRGGILVKDLGSSNGTWLGGVSLREATVPPGTRLSIGATVLRIEDAGIMEANPEGEAPLPELIGASDALREVTRLVRKLAPVASSVLIEGETGVGKEVVARALHDAGPRRDGPFVVADCASMPASLITSLLYGHEKGAFTGADQRRMGAFERASGGTLLLDEIGELPLDLQPTLLGVIERRRFCRVGGSSEVAVDVRVLAATNRDLRVEVNRGTFRADLYYRLAVARIVIPPLRERPEDIEPLARHFAEKLTGVPGDNPVAGVMEALRAHPWSGNARELRNVVEAAVVMGRVDLDGAASATAAGARAAEPTALAPYREARAEAIGRFEGTYLKALMEQCGGNASEAARRAHMDRPYLLTLLRRHGLR